MKPIIIGIAGGTCSGKSTLAKGLQKLYPDKITILSFDEYMINDDLYNLDDIVNFEDPALYDFPQFINDLKKLKSGVSLVIRGGSRDSLQSGVETKDILIKTVIVVEGFLLFYERGLCDLFDKKIFLELPDEEIVRRRLNRAKGTKYWDDPDYIKNKLIGYHHEYVEPQRDIVDLVISGLDSLEEVLAEAASHIKLWADF